MEDGHSSAGAEIRTAQLTDDAAHRSGRNWPGFVKFVLGLGTGAGHWTLGNDAGETTLGPSSARPRTSRAHAKHGPSYVRRTGKRIPRKEIREASVVGGRVMLAAGGESDSVRCQGDTRIRTPPRDGCEVSYNTQWCVQRRHALNEFSRPQTNLNSMIR